MCDKLEILNNSNKYNINITYYFGLNLIAV